MNRSTLIRPWLKLLLGVALLLGTSLSVACGRAVGNWQSTATPADCPPGETATIIWPVLDTLVPPAVAPGDAVEVRGHGGYVYCSGGLYNESARSFGLTFDGAALGTLGCYVNYCQTTITIPAEAAPGEHIIAAEGGSQISVLVQARSISQVVYLPLLIK